MASGDITLLPLAHDDVPGIQDVLTRYHDQEIDLIALDQALSKLETLNGRQAKIVELRFFAGLSIAEAAHVVGVGTTTVEEDWRMAKAWLGRQLKATPGA